MKQAAIPILVLVIIVGMAILTTWPAGSLEANHYLKFQDGNSLYSLLRSSVRTGDSVEVIAKVLGPATPLVEGLDEIRQQLEEDAQQHPERFPQGVYPQDVVMTYPVESGRLLLQFRNGFLINHDPEMFEDFYPEQDIAGKSDGVVRSSTQTEETLIGGMSEAF